MGPNLAWPDSYTSGGGGGGGGVYRHVESGEHRDFPPLSQFPPPWNFQNVHREWYQKYWYMSDDFPSLKNVQLKPRNNVPHSISCEYNELTVSITLLAPICLIVRPGKT